MGEEQFPEPYAVFLLYKIQRHSECYLHLSQDRYSMLTDTRVGFAVRVSDLGLTVSHRLFKCLAGQRYRGCVPSADPWRSQR